jgi:hypothetical protein
MMIPIKIYDNMNNLKIDNVNLNMALNFTFVCNTKKITSVTIQIVPHAFTLIPLLTQILFTSLSFQISQH